MAVKALFLDRDGVINEDTGYVFQVEHFHWKDGIFELCRMAISKGYIIIVVTNQSGIERGYFTQECFRNLTAWMCSCFESAGVKITEVLHCPTLSGPNRKPNPGMFLEAQKKYAIEMSSSVSLGDKERDVLAAQQAGVGTNFLLAEKNIASKANHIITTLKEMEKWL